MTRNKIKVLVVDDHTIMRDGIRALLGLHDDIKIVGEASEGREAIKKARELAPDVIVMDIGMHEMDGFEATRRIMKDNPKAKIVILTQYEDREYILSGIKAGALGYVPKRAISSELISAIRAIYQGESFLSPLISTVLVGHLLNHHEETKPHDGLTPREMEIMKLVTNGYKSREIAAILSIRLKTVLNHRMKVMNKLGIHSQTELIKYSLQNELVNIDEKLITVQKVNVH